MFLKLKISFKLIKNEIGIKGLILLTTATLLIGIGKETGQFYTASIIPGVIFFGFLFEFKLSYRKFLNQFLCFSNSIRWIKILALIWASLFSLYLLIFYYVLNKHIPGEIWVAVYQIFIIGYFAASYILLRFRYLIIMAAIILLLLTFLNGKYALFMNSVILLFSFYPFSIKNTFLAKPIKNLNYKDSVSHFLRQYSIKPSNYVIKFLYFTISRIDIHKIVIQVLLFFLILSMVYSIRIISQREVMKAVNFIIFILPVLLIIITTYSLVLFRKFQNQDQIGNYYFDYYIQLRGAYSVFFYMVITIILLSVLLISGISIISPEFILLFISVSFFAHAAFLLLYISEKYIINAFIAVILGFSISILPYIYQFISTLGFFISVYLYTYSKNVKKRYA